MAEEQVRQFLEMTPLVEKAIVDSGVILLKYWLKAPGLATLTKIRLPYHGKGKNLTFTFPLEMGCGFRS